MKQLITCAVLGLGLLAAPASAQEDLTKKKKSERTSAEDEERERQKSGWYLFGYALPEKDFKIYAKGYLQWDVHDYDFEIDPTLVNPTSQFPRRLRPTIDIEWKRVAIEFEMDPHDAEEHLKDAYIEVKVARGIRITAGNFKLPFSPELLTSESKVDFIERSMVASRLGPDRDWGAMIHGAAKKKLLYQFGVFAGDGRAAFERAGTTGAGRLVWTPIRGLDFGGSYMQGKVTPVPVLSATGIQADQKGFSGRGGSGFRFYERHYVNGWRRRLDLESSFDRGPFSLKAEWLEARSQRKNQGAPFTITGGTLTGIDIPDEIARGWSFSGTWLVTGDKKQRTIRPKRPLPHGPGAIELAARYEYLGFDDAGPATQFANSGNRARDIRAAGDHQFTGGLNWWPHRLVRLSGNVIVEKYKDPLLAPISQRGGNYVTLAGRMQFSLP